MNWFTPWNAKLFHQGKLVNLSIVKSIRRNRQFKQFKENGKRYNKRFFSLVVVKNNDYGKTSPIQSGIGLAVITSKKIGNAVKRNKIRRWIKEYFRKSKNRIPFNIDYLVITKPGIFEYGYENIIRDLENAIEKIREIYPPSGIYL